VGYNIGRPARQPIVSKERSVMGIQTPGHQTQRFFGSAASAVALIALLALTGCGETATTPPAGFLDVSTGLDIFPQLDIDKGTDAAQPGDVAVTGCSGDSECSGLTPGVCQQAKCQSGKCALIPTSGSSCDDGKACTGPDQCKSGTCSGAAKKCDDNNSCTTDSCDTTTGECKYVPQSGSCDDGQFCTTGDSCDGGKCVGTANPLCNCANDEDCKKSDDADLCNGINTCQNSQCKPKAGSVISCDSTKPGPCEVVSCEPASGKCKLAPVAVGAVCSDGDACTSSDACAGTTCSGKAVVCDDQNPCTTDSCDKAKGCVYAANTAACDDGDLCTKDDKCGSGKCSGTANPNCNACATDADCAKFENGNLCDGVLTCQTGTCAVKADSVVTCDPATAACKANTCEPTTGKCALGNALDGDKCDDSDVCTTGDRCEAGACAPGKQTVCDDNNPCTTDSCDKTSGCKSVNADTGTCDDGNPCTKDDTCSAGACSGTADGSCAPCQADADCQAAEDGNLCNGTLKCDAGKCIVNAASVVVCDTEGLSPCVQVECVPASGQCKKATLPNGSSCDDQNACTQKDYCSSGFCKGQPVICDDAKLCTDDSCDPDSGCSYQFNTAACDDGNPCSTGDACKAGQCTGTPAEDCVCTKDSDCLDDGDKCNGTPICVSQKCVTDPTTVVTCSAPADACSTSTCAAATGKCETTAQPDDKPCDDKNACTEGDTCKAGKCTPAKTISCDDKNLCSDDSCNPDFGCTYASNTAPCSDGNICTTGDACAYGQCQPGAPVSTNNCTDKCVPEWNISCGDSDAWATDILGFTTVVSQYACNPSETYDGPEYTYQYTAPYDCKMTATLTQETGFTDVIILDGAAGSCDSKACLAWGYASASIAAKTGKTYYIVVDGVSGSSGDFTISVGCVPDVETTCDDDVDEDADGKTDCADLDCAKADACQAPQCTAGLPISCGGSDSWATYSFGATNSIDSYGSCSPYTYSGPEYAYSFAAKTSGKVQVSLSAESAPTDLLVLQAAADGSCSSDQCLDYDFGPTGVSFEAEAGKTYFLVIDGFNGAQGSYTIAVDCGVEAPPEVCGNGLDDDGDGSTDCEDDACFGAEEGCQPACVPDTVELADLSCPSDEDFYNNGSKGSTNAIDSYSCNSSYDYSGPEYVYTYIADADTQVTVSLSDEDDDTDVLVLQDKGIGCNPASCLTAGTSGASFAAKKGQTYFIVVDGYEGAVGDYSLTFSCE
jgi:hypothetical protein